MIIIRCIIVIAATLSISEAFNPSVKRVVATKSTDVPLTHSQSFFPFPLENSVQFTVSRATSSSVSNEDAKPTSSLPPWLPCFITAALGGLLFGSDIGSSSSVVRILGGNIEDFGQLDSFQLGCKN